MTETIVDQEIHGHPEKSSGDFFRALQLPLNAETQTLLSLGQKEAEQSAEKQNPVEDILANVAKSEIVQAAQLAARDNSITDAVVQKLVAMCDQDIPFPEGGVSALEADLPGITQNIQDAFAQTVVAMAKELELLETPSV